MIDPSQFIPNEIKKNIYDGAIDLFARIAESTPLGEKGASTIRKLSTDADFLNSFDGAINKAIERFVNEYTNADLVDAIRTDPNFWKSKKVLDALQTLLMRPGAYIKEEKDTVIQSFADVLTSRIDRDEVDRAVSFFLSCLADELYTLPTLRPVYQLLFQRIDAERAIDMVRELHGLREESRASMLSLISIIKEQQKFLQQGTQSALLISGMQEKVKCDLPSRDYKFVGRKTEISDIMQQLKPEPDSRYHLIRIDGIGGVGKTALALELAYMYLNEFESLPQRERFYAIVFTSSKQWSLTSIGIEPRKQSQKNLEEIYAEIARILERPEINNASGTDQDRIVREALSHTRTLLIIDNFETVYDKRVMAFLRDLPVPTKALITTRYRIEAAYPLRLYGLPDPYVNELIDSECQNKRVVLTDEERARLATETAGVPLAIVWTIGQIGRKRSIKDALRKLKSAGGDYARFCFSESIELLENQNKWHSIRLLLSLSLFADGATSDALGYVSGLQDSRDTREEGLDDLTALSLINYDEEHVRYRMLELTKEYAMAEMSKDLEFKEESRKRWFEWNIKLIEQGGGGKVDLDARILENLESEHANILYAIDEAFDPSLFDVYVKLVKGMEFFWFGTGHWKEFELNLERGRNLVPLTSKIYRIHFAARLAWLSIMKEQFQKARELIADARKILKESPDEYEEMRVEDFTGQMFLQMGELDKAEAHLKKSLRIAKKREDRRGMFACMKYLGELHCKRGKVEIAKKYLVDAEGYAAGTPEDQWIRGLAHWFHLRGLISNVEQRWEEASQAFKRSVDYLKFWPDVRLMTRVLEQLAYAKFKSGSEDDARKYLAEAKDMFIQLGMIQKAYEMDTILYSWE